MRVRITRQAELDLQRGYRFYESQLAGRGEYFLDSVYADIDALVLYAGIHARPYGGFFRALATRFPFATYYDLDADNVTVAAVLDCRQDPDATRNRVG